MLDDKIKFTIKPGPDSVQLILDALQSSRAAIGDRKSYVLFGVTPVREDGGSTSVDVEITIDGEISQAPLNPIKGLFGIILEAVEQQLETLGEM